MGSFPVYLLHQSVIVIIGYAVVINVAEPIIQYIIITFGSLLITVGLYILCKHFTVTKFILGIK